jgi:hypothetical protein
MPLISIEELLFASKNAIQSQGLSEELSAEVAEEFVVAELAGTKTHGVGKLVSLHFGDLKAKPNIVEQRLRPFCRWEWRQRLCVVQAIGETRERALLEDRNRGGFHTQLQSV